MPNSIYWQSVWVICGAAIFFSALFAARSRTAMYLGRAAIGILFVAAGAFFNALNLASGGDYGTFAQDSYIPFVRHTWLSLVAPHQDIFIPLLIAFEVAVGLLAVSGGRRTQLALVGVIGFHLGLMCFGWIYYAWSIPMIFSFVLLLRAERRHAAEGVVVTIHEEYRMVA